MPEPEPGGEKCDGNHGDLAQFHTDIECDQAIHKVAPREPDFVQDSSEPKSVQQSEAEYDIRSPRRQFVGEEIFRGDIDDRGCDERLND